MNPLRPIRMDYGNAGSGYAYEPLGEGRSPRGEAQRSDYPLVGAGCKGILAETIAICCMPLIGK